jgi:hypothetical protein
MNHLLLNNLEIRQFRRFENLSVEKLGRVNLFVGKNNVGKTTLLEALNLYANIGSPGVMLDILGARDNLTDHNLHGRNARVSQGPAIWSLFNGTKELARIDQAIQIGPISKPDSTLSIAIEWFTEKMGADGRTALEPTTLTEDSTITELVPALVIRIAGARRAFRLDRSFKNYARRWQFQPQAFLDLATRCTFVGPNGLSAAQLERMWNIVALTPLEEDVTDALRLIVPTVEDFALLRRDGGREMSVRIKPDKESLPQALRCMGDGMNRLFGLGLAMVTSGDGILLVDEIENGIHYSVLPSLWRFVARLAHRLNVQVFATSHSLDCIKAFHEVTSADKSIEGVLARLEVREGELRAAVFDEAKLDRFLGEDIEIR